MVGVSNTKYIQSKAQQGFTLIEVLIVVAIIGVLAAVAYPNYVKYIQRSNRTDVMVEMQQIASRIEANKITYKRYDKIPLTEIFTTTPTSGSVPYPSSGTALYTITVSPVSGTTLGGSNWTLTAAPIATASMKDSGNLTLEASGKKCWKPASGDKCGMNDEWQ